VNELAGLINDRTKLIILNSPQNPTGGVLTKKDIEEIAAAIGDRNVMVMSDEIYSRLIFEGEHHSIMSVDGMKDRCILLDGFSKNIRDDRLADGLRSDACRSGDACCAIDDELQLVHRGFTQMAGVEALRGPQDPLSDVRRIQKATRRNGSRPDKIKGFSCRLPKGAFYVFPNITGTGWPSKKLADALLDEAGVAGLSGTAFGDFGEGYLRFSVANSIENIEKALDRVGAWVNQHL